MKTSKKSKEIIAIANENNSIYSGTVFVTNSFRRTGGYFSYKTVNKVGHFLFFKNEIYQICVNSNDELDCILIVSSRKKNFKTELKQVSLKIVKNSFNLKLKTRNELINRQLVLDSEISKIENVLNGQCFKQIQFIKEKTFIGSIKKYDLF